MGEEIDRNSAKRIFVTWPHIKRMLHYRGYDVSSLVEDIEEDENALQELAKNHYRFQVHHNNDPKQFITIIYYFEDKLGVKFVRTLMENLQSNGKDHAIILSPVGASPFTLKEIAKYANTMQIEFFLYDNLHFSLIEHELNKGTYILSEEEKGYLLKTLQATEEQLPRISIKDPIAKYLNVKKGQVVASIRKNGNQECTYYYRLCE